MKKLKEILNNLVKDIPVTIITIFLITIFFAFTVDTDFQKEDIIEKVLTFAFIFSLQTFFTEIYFEKKYRRIIGYVVSAVIAFGFTSLLFSNAGINSLITIEITARILIGYLMTVFVLSIYKLYKKSGLSLEYYIIEVFKNAINTAILYGITNIGIMLVIVLFIDLILADTDFGIIMRTQILLFGLVLIPLTLSGISVKNKERKISKFIKVLTLYIMFSLICIASVIIYLYIGKIFLTDEMPSNEIFRILVALFVFSFPIWVMSFNYIEENKLVEKLSKALPLAFIPFIFLQIYSMGLRSWTYGLTPLRYLSYIFIVFEIFAILLSVYKKREKLEKIFFITAILVIVSTVSPVNCIDLSNISQRNRLNKNLEFAKTGGISNEQKAEIASSYNYLRYETTAKKYIDKLTDEEINIIEDCKNHENEYSDNYKYSNNINKIDYQTYWIDGTREVDISNYKSFMSIVIEEYGVYGEEKEYDFKNISYFDNTRSGFNNQSLGTVNIENWVNLFLVEYLKDKPTREQINVNKYLETNKIINVNENTDVFVTNISMQYNNISDNINFISIQGYLFKK